MYKLDRRVYDSIVKYTYLSVLPQKKTSAAFHIAVSGPWLKI
jgi:hypothetical protein